jgi:hypothetical protein
VKTVRFLRMMLLASAGGLATSCVAPEAGAADAGAAPTVAPLPADVAQPAPLASEPRAPMTPQADADGCFSYWEQLESACQEEATQADSGKMPCDPAHERATRAVLTAILGRPAGAQDAVVREYLRGVAWNDDPENLLFEAAPPHGISTRWCRRFQAAQVRARQGRAAGSRDSLLDRSQFGDLQFLHGMASRPGEKAIDTYERIMSWLELTYRITTGEIPGETVVSQVPVKGIAALLPKQRSSTLSQLFGVGPDGDIRARAMGSLLHVIQDLAGSGHIALRLTRDRTTPNVDHFFTYAGATHPHHRGDDGWRNASAAGALVDDVPGLRGSVDRGIDIVRLAERKEPWPTVKLFLDRFYFELADFQAPAVRWGAGRRN